MIFSVRRGHTAPRTRGLDLSVAPRDATGVRSCFAFALVLLSGCGARTIGLDESEPAAEGGAPHFPEGTWSHCTEALENPDGNVFLNGIGAVPDASLTLTESGSTVTADYERAPALSRILDFTVSSAASARLSHAGQTLSGYSGLCVQGIGFSNEVPFPASLEANGGALIEAGGTLFLSAAGTLSGVAGPCGTPSTPAHAWVVCQDGPALDPVLAPNVVNGVPGGTLSCHSQIATEYQGGATTWFIGSGGTGGTLTITQVGTELTTLYAGDPSVSGTLHLTGVATDAARSLDTESLLAPCEVPNLGDDSLAPLSVTTASLAVLGSAVLLSFTGSLGTGSPCPGARKVVTVICPTS